MLSGYTEVASLTDAINRGAIYKFVTKPWNDDDLRQVIAKPSSRTQGHRIKPAMADLPGGPT
ncbi:MAG: hypothetical protein IPP85_19205 [Propionivibrio sp.]|nr:hypothetical protein [Propionivibrio sp.]